MNIITTFKHMDSTEALTEFTEEKLSAIFPENFERPQQAHVVLSVDGHKNTAAVNFTMHNGQEIHLNLSGDNMYETIEHLCVKAKKQLLKEHGKKVTNRLHERETIKNQRNFNSNEPEEPAIDAEDILRENQSRT